MQTVLFSKNGIHYKDSGTGLIKGIFIPAATDTQKFVDISNANDADIKQRCPEITGTPLYRKTGEAIHVFGEMSGNLVENRQGVEVFLPQDYVPKNSTVFYFVFGSDYIIHGVKKTNDNGEVSWGTSLIDIKNKDLNKIIISSISDRMLVGDDETITIATHGDDNVRENLQSSLNAFNIIVDKFESLSTARHVPPVYLHKNYGLMMVTIVIFSFLLMGATTAYFVRNSIKLSNINNEITELSSEIRKMQNSRKLGYIKNPKKILDTMEKPLKQQPSAIIHAIGTSSKTLGDLNELSFKTINNLGTRKGQMVADIKLVNIKSKMLVDQESFATIGIASQPWIRKIELIDNKGKRSRSLPLKIWVQVE